jgi:lipopolysaccharide/colanic/teichoic acid biosynthesis glycosyltransferase
MDVTISTAALLLSAPVLAAAALAIAAVSPGSPVFAQERVGKGGRRFKMYKLRTMHAGAHLMHHRMHAYNEVSGPVLKIKDDPRLHALGSFLRRTSIDELPNLINVLRGEMSLVGPRPPLPSEVEHYDDFAMRRLTVKPGITCTWQIGGRSNISFEEWMQLDNAYVDSWTPYGDFVILLRAIPAVSSGDGAH